MKPEPPSEQELFHAALELPPAQRAAYLAQACAGDTALRAHVEALLAVQPSADALFDPACQETQAGGTGASGTGTVCLTSLTEKPGDLIGLYKLREQVGEGGCGTVYVAEQEKPIRRKVALKVIKLGMDTKSVIARFEAERQALAMMDHPNIAKVLDAGTTAAGRPFFVMELVRGIRITDYCDQANLSTKDRLDLFIKVCSAIQHAHQKGIIHRDIKPSNILVTLHDGVPVPKVIDFGIAKATEGRLTDATVYTELHAFVGTPAYMSPEQAEMSGLDIDTRSDIYSLGVLLYELLTGKPPFDAKELMSQGIDAMRRTIREMEPARPSTRLGTLGGDDLTTLAKRRSVPTSQLQHQLKGDLDWIVMKALEKDRTRRYETANSFAADITRHLTNEPVIARPPTAAYRFQKAYRRNRIAFAAAGAVTAALLIGIAASLWQAVRASRALDELRATAPAFAEQARGLAAKEQYADAIAKLDYAIKLRPDAAEFLVAKGDLLQCQLQLAAAAALYREALRVQPGHARAEASAKLCEELLAAKPAADGKLSRESLAKLHVAMQQQQRPTAELLPVARLLGEEKKLLLDYWLARLKDLPVSAEKPLAQRLTAREDGRLALDLGDTKVTDLTPLVGAPLAALDLSRSKELTDVSPLRGIALVELNLNGTSVADLTPLREMNSLERLEMAESKVTDLAALSALRLKRLNFQNCAVSDLRPIRTMPIELMQLAGTRVFDLSPLLGMPIKTIDLSHTPVVDFSPLGQLPLEKCLLQGNRITDLTVLRGKPLKELTLWRCEEARNYSAIAEIPTLELLLLPTEYRSLPANDLAAIASLRGHPKLRQLGADAMVGMNYSATGSKDIFWQDWDREQTFVPALRAKGIQFSLTKQASGTYALVIQDQPLRDLSILKGAPISELVLYPCPVSDLTPIRDLRLEVLAIRSDLLADLSPLRGMPLKRLYLNGSKITDLSPLKSLPLLELYLDGCPNVDDVADVAEIATLEKLTVPSGAANIDALRKLPALQMLAFNRSGNAMLPASTAQEFWKGYDWISRLRKAGIQPKTLKRLDDGTWEVSLEGSGLSDLSPLEGAPISTLWIGGTTVADLTPLRGMPLKSLRCFNTKVTDLNPLHGMSLGYLHLSGTKVTDLSPLRGMPLSYLRLHGCTELTDLSPLADTKGLTSLTLPPNAKNIEFLRVFPKLERIGYKDDPKNGYRADQTAAEFWKDHDAKKPAPK